MAAKELKIAMLSVHSCPVGTLGSRDTGGMSVYIVELASALGKLGHLVDVYTRVHDPRDRQIYALGKDVSLIHLKAGEDEQIHKLAVYPHLPDFACGLEAFRKENNLQYDIVFSHYWLSAWVGEYLQQWWHIPHLTMFHTLGAVKNTTGIGEDEPELRTETEKEMARSCYHIIAPTEREKEGIVQHYGASAQKISVVPCGVNLELFRPVDKDKAKRELGLGNDRIILFVGRIEAVKGIEQLVRAVSYLQNKRGSRLVIIGGDDASHHETEKLSTLAGELSIEDKITFVGSVRQERLPYYYSAADVCVISSYYESFGLVALESLACGTPVVATDVGGSRSIIREGETGYVVADNEPHHLAEKIDLLLSRRSPDINSALSIRASVSRYSWPNIAEAIVGEFQNVLDSFMAPVPR
ncbi:MAG TPA: glycosyltransferase [Dehalococcoidales bacterium]|nr:glycosyltransferase [Dehalococcoidales bacterium]